MLISEILEEQGFVALEAGNAADGLRLLQSNDRIGLLVADLGLPGGMNGRQLAEAALRRRPDLKILFITGYADPDTLSDAALSADIQVLAKPFAMDALAARLRDLGCG